MHSSYRVQVSPTKLLEDLPKNTRTQWGPRGKNRTPEIPFRLFLSPTMATAEARVDFAGVYSK